MKKNDKPDYNLYIVTILGILSIISVFIFAFLIDDYSHSEYEYLEDGLNSLDNVSDEYRQGWMDCIEELKEFNTMVSNVTDQFI